MSVLQIHGRTLSNVNLHAKRPHQLWVADITYVHTVDDVAYTASVTDVFTRRIAGWALPSSPHTQTLPLMAVEHTLVPTGASRAGEGLIHHSDKGDPSTSLWRTPTRSPPGCGPRSLPSATPLDNAMAETINSLYKAELIHSQRMWESAQALEITTIQ